MNTGEIPPNTALLAMIGSPAHRQLLKNQKIARDAYHQPHATVADRLAAEAAVTAAAEAIRKFLNVQH
jgi:hypothetical protein